MNIADPGDDLQRYVDILFADYRQSEPARRLRIDMLNDLLLEKERLRMEGLSEKEAISVVLQQLQLEGAPVECSLLIYSDRFERDSSQSLFLWSLAALIMSTPLLALGQWLIPALLLAAALVLAARAWQRTGHSAVEDVEFRCADELRRPNRLLWLGWLGISVLWCVLAAVLSRSLGDGLLQTAGGLLGQAQMAARYYAPLLLLAFPLWGSGRERLLYKNEVGADHDDESGPTNWLRKILR